MLQANVRENGLSHKIEMLRAVVGDGCPMRRVEVEGNTGAAYYLFDEGAEVTAEGAYALLCERGFGRPNFVKLDIEGMELVVLRALESLIMESRPKLYIEVASELLARCFAMTLDIHNYPSRFDYRFYRNNGEGNYSNDVFVNRELRNIEDGAAFFDLLALPA